METAAEPVGIVTASVLLGAFILKATDLVKYLVEARRGDANGLITLLLTWVIGIVAVMVFAKTQWGDEVKIGDESLESLSTWSKVVLGVAAPSIAAILYDVKKAVDNTESSSTPRLTDKAETARKARLALTLPASTRTDPPR
jgi:hypothetical protein